MGSNLSQNLEIQVLAAVEIGLKYCQKICKRLPQEFGTQRKTHANSSLVLMSKSSLQALGFPTTSRNTSSALNLNSSMRHGAITTLILLELEQQSKISSTLLLYPSQM